MGVPDLDTEGVRAGAEDDLEAFEARNTSRIIPAGCAVLFWGLVGFGLYYLWAYSPALGGWSQARELEESSAAAAGSAGLQIAATVLFTAVAAAFAVGIMMRRARASRKR